MVQPFFFQTIDDLYRQYELLRREKGSTEKPTSKENEKPFLESLNGSEQPLSTSTSVRKQQQQQQQQQQQNNVGVKPVFDDDSFSSFFDLSNNSSSSSQDVTSRLNDSGPHQSGTSVPLSRLLSQSMTNGLTHNNTEPLSSPSLVTPLTQADRQIFKRIVSLQPSTSNVKASPSKPAISKRSSVPPSSTNKRGGLNVSVAEMTADTAARAAFPSLSEQNEGEAVMSENTNQRINLPVNVVPANFFVRNRNSSSASSSSLELTSMTVKPLSLSALLHQNIEASSKNVVEEGKPSLARNEKKDTGEIFHVHNDKVNRS